MKYLFLCLLFVNNVFASNHVNSWGLKSKILEKTAGRTVNVIAKSVSKDAFGFKRDKTASGTGFWIDSRHIVTAQHVIKDASAIFVRGHLDKEFQVVKRSGKSDVAILRSSQKGPYDKIVFAKDTPGYGRSVFVWTAYDNIRDRKGNVVLVLNMSHIAARYVLRESSTIRPASNSEFMISEVVSSSQRIALPYTNLSLWKFSSKSFSTFQKIKTRKTLQSG